MRSLGLILSQCTADDCMQCCLGTCHKSSVLCGGCISKIRRGKWRPPCPFNDAGITSSMILSVSSTTAVIPLLWNLLPPNAVLDIDH